MVGHSDATDAVVPKPSRCQFGLASVLRLVAVLAVLFAIPGVLPLLGIVMGSMLLVLAGFAALLLLQFPLFLVLRGLRGTDGDEGASS